MVFSKLWQSSAQKQQFQTRVSHSKHYKLSAHGPTLPTATSTAICYMPLCAFEKLYLLFVWRLCFQALKNRCRHWDSFFVRKFYLLQCKGLYFRAFFGSGNGVGIPAKSHYNTPCVCPLSPIWGKAIRPHTLAPLRPWTCCACEVGGGMYTRARPLAIQYRTSQRRREKQYGSICINTRCTKYANNMRTSPQKRCITMYIRHCLCIIIYFSPILFAKL